MDSLARFLVVALAALLVGIPLWTLVLAPGEFSPGMLAEPGFWVTVGIGLALLVGGFVLGRRADLG